MCRIKVSHCHKFPNYPTHLPSMTAEVNSHQKKKKKELLLHFRDIQAHTQHVKATKLKSQDSQRLQVMD